MTLSSAAPLRLSASPAHAEVDRRVASGAYDVLSLDVFDTFLVRDVPTPIDGFFVVAARLQRTGALWPGTPAEAFVRERVAAEQRARRRSRTFEVTLPGIYAAFPAGFLRGRAPADVAVLEFEVERGLLHPVPGARTLLEHARSCGLRVVFVSDTYFSAEQIRLLTGGIADAVFASCEHGRSKTAGLHEVVAAELGVPAGRILHAGDHPIADVEGPISHGVHAALLPRWPGEWEEAIRAELPRTYTARAPILGEGDLGLTHQRRAAAWGTEDAYERWGRIVLGPVIGGFTSWIRNRCEEEGIDHALCLMREGRLLRTLLAGTGESPIAHECFVSRYAARRAAILRGGAAEIEAFMRRTRPTPRGRLMEQLGLERDALGDPAERLEGPALHDLARRLAANRRWQERIVETSAVARRGLVAHLRRLLPDDAGRRVAVVDLGYAGTIQACLERIACHEMLPFRTHGLYLVTGAEVHGAQATGAPAEGFLASNGQPAAMAHTFLRSPEVVEQSLMADCGTTLGHTSEGEPILGNSELPESQREGTRRIQGGVLDWHATQCEREAAGAPMDPEALRAHLQAILVRAIARPSAHERDLFRDWQHDENLGAESTRELFEPAGLHPWEASHLSPHQLASLPSAQLFWPCGWAHERSPEWGEAVANIFLRQCEPAMLHGIAGERPLIVYTDSGQGFHPEAARLERVALGPGGRAWHRVRFELEQADVRRWAIGFGLPGEIVGITGVRIHLHPVGGEPRTIDRPFASLVHAGYEALTPPLLRVVEDPAIVVVEGEPLERWTGVLMLDLFLSSVPQS